MSRRDLPIVACDDCQAPVIWAVDDDGERIRVDAVPVHDGNVALEIDANSVVIAHRGSMAQTFGQARNDLRMAHKATCGRWPGRLPKHAFALDERIPADYAGRRWCMCGVPGEPGDERHPDGAPPLRAPLPAPEVFEQAGRELDAAILGERDDGGDEDLLSLLRVTARRLELPPQDLADRVLNRLASDLRGSDTAS